MLSNKRIAFLVSDLRFGGISTVTVNLICAIAKHDYSIDLVTLTTDDSPYLSQLPPAVRVIDLKHPIPDATLKNAIRIIQPIRHYLNAEKPDFLIPNLWMYNSFAIIAKLIANTSTIITIVEHDHLLIELKAFKSQSNNFLSGFQTKLYPTLVKLIYPFADNIVAVSKGLARDLEAEFKLRSGVIASIYNPIINPSLLAKAKEAVNHPWFAEDQPPVILGVGRLSEEKDFATLIHAFAKIRKERAAHLMILGEGKERAALEKLVQELEVGKDVLMPGFESNPYAYMARASVFILSSLREGLPTVLVEAMAVGTPVISTNCKGGAGEILADGKFGELVPVEDTQAMAAAILEVLDGRFKAVDKAWLEQFTLESATQCYLEAIRAN